MPQNKEDLDKLLLFIAEISNEQGNEWFKHKLQSVFFKEINHLNSSSAIDEIYEYCIRLIIKTQAEKFYGDFKINEIKDTLINDFIRMEKFRREDNFGDFSLAVYQQLEAIVNKLLNNNVYSYIQEHNEDQTHKVRNKNSGINESQKLWQLIFYPQLSKEDLQKKMAKSINEWDFLERYKTVLFYYYFNKKIYNYHDFQAIFFLGNDLHHSRNSSHRGSKVSEAQQKAIDRIEMSSSKYYFKFLGFLEDFITKVNLQI